MKQDLPVRVCHIISGDLWGGAEAVVYHLSRSLNVLGIEVSVVTFNEGRLTESLRKAGLDVAVVDESAHSFLWLVMAVRRHVIARGATVIHSHGYKENMVALVLSRLGVPVKLVATQHGWPEVYGSKHNMKYRFLNRLNIAVMSLFFDHLACVSEDMRNRLVERYGRSGARAQVVRNGIDVNIDVPEKTRGALFIIGSCGRFVPVKDYPFLVAVAAYVREKNRNVVFKIAGDGPELERVKALVRSNNLEDSFACIGAVADMDRFYQELDVYINTSIQEGMPISILEAMLHGLPIVAPRVGGIAEMVTDDVEGYTIYERDASRYGDCCLDLIQNVELYREMSKAAVARVKRSFSSEKMARDYLTMYLNTLEIRQ